MRDGEGIEQRELHAYRDGELPLWRRWRVARRLREEPAAQRELAGITELGALLREHAAVQPVPDLWADVRARLATAERPAPLEADDAVPARAPWLPAWLGAGLAAASVAAVMATGWLAGDAAPQGSVRWVDSKGKPVIVLQDDRDATIIWVLQKPKVQSTLRGRDAMV